MSKLALRLQSFSTAGCLAFALPFIFAVVKAVWPVQGVRQSLASDWPLLIVVVLFVWVAVLLMARKVVLGNTRAALERMLDESGEIPRSPAFEQQRNSYFPEPVCLYLGLSTRAELASEGDDDS